jgi:hypothetical protein
VKVTSVLFSGGEYLHSKREEVAGGWRRLQNEELRNLYPAPNIIRVIKSRRMRWAGQVACIEETSNAYRSENLKEIDHSEDLRVDGKIILVWILGR